TATCRNHKRTGARSSSNTNTAEKSAILFHGYTSTKTRLSKSPNDWAGWYKFFMRMSMTSIWPEWSGKLGDFPSFSSGQKKSRFRDQEIAIIHYDPAHYNNCRRRQPTPLAGKATDSPIAPCPRQAPRSIDPLETCIRQQCGRNFDTSIRLVVFEDGRHDAG